MDGLGLGLRSVSMYINQFKLRAIERIPKLKKNPDFEAIVKTVSFFRPAVVLFTSQNILVTALSSTPVEGITML